MSLVTTRLPTPSTRISAQLSWILATLTSKLVCSFYARVLPMVALRTLPSQPTFIPKLTRLRDLSDLNGDPVAPPTVTLPLPRVLLVRAGPGVCPTSTHRLSPLTPTRTGARVTEAPRQFSDSRVLNKTSRCDRDILSQTADYHHPDEASRRRRVLVVTTHLITKPASLRVKLNPFLTLEELPTPVGVVLLRLPLSSLLQVTRTVLMAPTVSLPSGRIIALALESALSTTTGCRLQSRPILSTLHPPRLTLTSKKHQPMLLPRAASHSLLPLLRQSLRRVLRSALPRLAQSACVSGKRSPPPRNRPTKRTAHA